MPGQLFTHYFLTDGIKTTVEWQESVKNPQRFETFRSEISTRLESFTAYTEPNEAVTEQELIRPILDLLGWQDYLPQQSVSGGEDIPDNLLFEDADSKTRAASRTDPEARFHDALLVQESKRFGLPLDSRDSSDQSQRSSPHAQILRYLQTADTVSEGRIRFGILTNGSDWRLYDQRARPRASGYFEADLRTMLDHENVNDLRAFYLLFRRQSFILRPGATATFIESALTEGRRYEEQVAQDLSIVVFDRVFPNLVDALAKAVVVGQWPMIREENNRGPALQEIRDAALIFLYRLLFILYAEDRGLLPVNDSRYDDYGLRKRVRDDVASRTAEGDAFSSVASNYYNRLIELFHLIDKGDASIGLPPYNGGLFASETASLLEEVHLADAKIAPIIYDLSHTDTNKTRRFVNYRDMSVQQLGSIYERLLEREPAFNADGSVTIRPNSYARKDSGSFYTPQELVDLIVDRTLKPLTEERLKAFEDKAIALKSDRRPKNQRLVELKKFDPAEAVLDLKVLDPAMGSGHFLVTAVDFLSDYIAELIEYVPAVPDWLDDGYVSPLVERISLIRRDIIRRAGKANWVLNETQLTDQAIIRRMVLKRCIYGVDKNRMSVELAKVSLWLHSFTVGAPLSFLDHHLRCGDSLIGLKVTDAVDELNRLSGLFVSSAIAGAEGAAAGMRLIEELSDADIAEVRNSAALFGEVVETTADLQGLLDFLCGFRWITAGMNKKRRDSLESPLIDALQEDLQKAYVLLSHGPPNQTETSHRDNSRNRTDHEESACTGAAFSESSIFEQIWQDTKSIARREEFLHWEVAFPGVWQYWQNKRPQGGFDAVIGNPPWDRIKLQEVEWFATHVPELAHAATAAARRNGIQQLRHQGDPLAEKFDAAKERADKLGQWFRASGNYPLLGGGDINLYSLFVERAMSLVKPDGIVGLLTPSGIYADKTAARFFKSVSTAGRVAGLFDFENKKIFFKDIHASFKFCALIFGGEQRRFDETRCAYFLRDTATINDPQRCFPLTPEDFARVNPNTGTAPVFRTQRDAEITLRIYERHPVLVNRSQGEERKAWPVRYHTMFHMANDSDLFRTAAQLEAEGFYPVQSNRWKRRKELYLPLYEGKMVQAFDHRAADSTENEQNLFRPGQREAISDSEKQNIARLPIARYFVQVNENRWVSDNNWVIAFKNITAITNMRTMITAVIPRVGAGHSLNLLLISDDINDPAPFACSIVANMNAFSFDFVSRQKVPGNNFTWYLLEQLPVIASDDYERRFGNKTARELVRDHVLRLTYTAHDMTPFARDLGHEGPPFIWNEEERRHLRARLDALYFHLYGLDRENAAYILDTFPIVRKQDEAEFGHYRTKIMILAYMNALAAGDTETVVKV